ncbi:MAG: hypothetical protein ABI256_04530 [Rhodoferax sp.]
MSVLLGSFLLSLLALFFFVWSLSKNLFGSGVTAATEIFAPNELGRVEDPAATRRQKAELQRAMDPPAPTEPDMTQAAADTCERADQSSLLVVAGVCLTLAVVCLVIASLAGLTAFLKLHMLDWWTHWARLTFGRFRPTSHFSTAETLVFRKAANTA